MASAPTLEQRIRAACALAGINSTEALGERIGQRGLSGRTLRDKLKYETWEPRDLSAVAEACGVPVAFFTVDYNDLARLDELPLSITERLDRIEAMLARLTAPASTSGQPQAGSPQDFELGPQSQRSKRTDEATG